MQHTIKYSISFWSNELEFAYNILSGDVYLNVEQDWLKNSISKKKKNGVYDNFAQRGQYDYIQYFKYFVKLKNNISYNCYYI